MVLGKLSVPGHSVNLDSSRARAFRASSKCRSGLFGHFFSLIYLYTYLPLSVGDGPILTEILSQRAVKAKNNQPTYHQIYSKLWEALNY